MRRDLQVMRSGRGQAVPIRNDGPRLESAVSQPPNYLHSIAEDDEPAIIFLQGKNESIAWELTLKLTPIVRRLNGYSDLRHRRDSAHDMLVPIPHVPIGDDKHITKAQLTRLEAGTDHLIRIQTRTNRSQDAIIG